MVFSPLFIAFHRIILGGRIRGKSTGRLTGGILLKGIPFDTQRRYGETQYGGRREKRRHGGIPARFDFFHFIPTARNLSQIYRWNWKHLFPARAYRGFLIREQDKCSLR